MRWVPIGLVWNAGCVLWELSAGRRQLRGLVVRCSHQEKSADTEKLHNRDPLMRARKYTTIARVYLETYIYTRV